LQTIRGIEVNVMEQNGCEAASLLARGKHQGQRECISQCHWGEDALHKYVHMWLLCLERWMHKREESEYLKGCAFSARHH